MHVLDALADADRTVTEQATHATRGLLRVAAPMSLGLTVVGPAVNDFLAAHPEVQLDLEMDDRAVDIVQQGFDVCIRGTGALADSSLVARKIGRIERVPIAAPAYLAKRGTPKRPADLARHDALVYGLAASPKRWTFVKGTKKESVLVEGPLRVNSSLALVQSAAAGLGVAFVPAVTATRELADRAVVRLLPDWQGEPQSLYAIQPKHHEASRLLRAFIDHVARRLATR